MTLRQMRWLELQQSFFREGATVAQADAETVAALGHYAPRDGREDWQLGSDETFEVWDVGANDD